ncbi:MAG: AI-2E family transporter [Cyanobacteria bacterium P01_A01_bin.135]
MKFGQWLGLIALVISLVILWEIRRMLLLIFAAVVLATALNGLVRQLQRRSLCRRGTAVMITVVSVLLCSSLFIALVVPPFVNQFRRLILQFPYVLELGVQRIEVLVENPPAWLPMLELPNLELPDLGTLTQQLQPIISDILQNFFEFFNSSLTVLLQILLVLVLTLMLLADPMRYRQAAIKLFPAFYRRRADSIFTQCEVALGNWLGGIVVNSLFVAMVSGVGLSLLNIDLVLAHALLAGLLNFIPNIGPALSVVFPLSVALTGPLWKVVAVVILYVLIQNLESYWVSPAVMAKQVALLPAVTLTAQLFFASFFGVLGLILALPLAVVVKTWLQEALIKDVLDRCESQWGVGPPAIANGATELPPEDSPVEGVPTEERTS